MLLRLGLAVGNPPTVSLALRVRAGAAMNAKSDACIAPLGCHGRLLYAGKPVLGFIRDIMTAAILGAGPVADAFFRRAAPAQLFAASSPRVPSAPLRAARLGDAGRGGKAALPRICREAFAALSPAPRFFLLG